MKIHMRTRTISILASLAMILIVAGAGNAFATTSWSGTDSSKLVSTGYASWNSYVSGAPSNTIGSQVTWGNDWTNALSRIYYPAYTIENEDKTTAQAVTLNYALNQNQKYPPSGTFSLGYTAASPAGNRKIFVSHLYNTVSSGDPRIYGIMTNNPSAVEQDYTST
jgi:hypothetical protein